MKNLSVVAFDLDDTLTVSKSKIDPRMAALLGSLMLQVDVCIISGGRFEQFDSQVLQFLTVSGEARRRLHLMPTCGTRYYRWINSEWHQIYSEDLTPESKSKITSVLIEGAKHLGLWESETWGEIIEDRGSQITFSALGQAAPPEAKYAWDPDGSKKHRLREYAAERLPELEVRGGGSTSVDVTKKGVDKAYGMRKLMEHLNVGIDEILFIGDRLDVGGNDYPVRAMGIKSIEVDGWEETAQEVERLLAEIGSNALR